MIASLLLALCAASSSGPQGDVAPSRLEPAIEAERLKALVASLCTTETAGRATGTPGFDVAAEVVVAELERLGLVPGGDEGFRQWVPIVRWSVAAPAAQEDSSGAPEAPRLFVTDRAGQEHEFVCGIDFNLPVGKDGAPPQAGSMEVVMVRSLDELPDQADPNAALYFRGRAVRAQARDWMETKGQARTDWGLYIVDRSHLSGRAEVIPESFVTLDLGQDDPGDVLLVRGKALELFKAEDVTRIRLDVHWQREELLSENVVGIIPGVGSSDAPQLADEVVVLTANLDHLGRKQLPGGGNRVFTYPGADNNASGVAALLEVAEALVVDPPARTTLFVFATGNEQNFLGMRYQLRAPSLPLEKTKLALEVFALGSPDPLLPVSEGLWCTSFTDTSVGPALQQKDLLIFPDERYRWSFATRSSSHLYVLAGIIGHRLSSFGAHKRLFTPQDTPQSLDYAHMERATRVLLDAIRALCSGSIPIEKT